MKTLDVLRAARALILDPQHWTQGASARDKHGKPVGTTSPDACQWCAYGAAFKVGGNAGGNACNELTTSSHSLGFGIAVARINDELGHSVIIRIYDHAIARLEVEAAA